MKTFIFGLALAALALFCEPGSAQNVNLNCFTGVSPFWAPCSSTNPLQTSGSGGGGGGGGAGGTFAPTTPPSTTTLTATASSSASTALPTGSAVLFQNVGTTTVSCVLATGAATATVDNIQIPAGGVSLILVGTNVNTACINQTGTASNKVDLIGGAVSTFGNNADALATITSGLIGQQAFGMCFNGTTWDRCRSISGAIADATTPPTVGILEIQAFLMAFNGATWDRLQGITLGPAIDTSSLPVLSPTPSSSATIGITPVVGGSAVSSLVLKATPGNLYSVYANCTSACWLMIFNATAAPANGATTAGVASGNMVECVPIGAGSVGGLTYIPGPPAVYSVGITATISSTACSTLTLSTVGFIHGMIK